MNQATKTTSLARVTDAFASSHRLMALARLGRIWKPLDNILVRIGRRIRAVDISVIMLIFGLLLALAIVLGLALDPVARRH